MTIEEMKVKKTEHGYTYEQIAIAAGVPVGTVQKVLGGITKSPRYDTLQALERFFVRQDASDMPNDKKTLHGAAGRSEGHAADFQALVNDQNSERIDGLVYELNPPTIVQQRIVGELFSQIRTQVDDSGRLGDGSCIVPLMAPITVCLDSEGDTIVHPDLLLLSDNQKLKRWGILGAPDFLLEVLTSKERRKTNLKKIAKYAESGVREYWLIDIVEKKLIIYPLEKDGCLKVFKLDGRVPIGILNGLFIDLKRVAELICDYPET